MVHICGSDLQLADPLHEESAISEQLQPARPGPSHDQPDPKACQYHQRTVLACKPPAGCGLELAIDSFALRFFKDMDFEQAIEANSNL